MRNVDERIVSRFVELKSTRWPESLHLTPSALDLSGERIKEDLVSTIDEFEQCWIDEYHLDVAYNFLNQMIATAVAFQVRSIGKEKGIYIVEIADVGVAPVLEHVYSSVEYALECKDILSVEEIF